jgi:dTDP-4-dehydrorhamnose reductase
MLGEAFYKVFCPSNTLKCTDKDVNEDWLSYLDFRDFDAYYRDVADFRPDYIFHLGAHTSLEYCEQDPNNAYITNTLAVENAVHISNALAVPILYISTAGIFDGAKDVYDDWDDPNPLSHYARSKLMGERYVQQNCQKHLICRAGWMMGGGPAKDKKFIQKLMAQLKAKQTELFIVNDKFGTPTYTHDFARNVGLLLEQGYWGIYNMVCEGVTDRFEVARSLVHIIGWTDRIKITPVNSDFFAQEYFAPRPSSERLITTKLNLRGLNIMRPWQVCLAEYLKDYYEGYL